MAGTLNDPFDTATAAVATGELVIEYPFAEYGDSTHIVASQAYVVAPAKYVPAVLNDTISFTPPGGSAQTLYGVGDSEPREQGGLVRYVRRWANKPASRDEAGGSYVATFPGIEAERVSFTRTVPSIITHDFLRVAASGGDATSAGALALVSASTFLYSGYSLPQSADGFFLGGSTTPSEATWITAVTAAAYTYVVEDSTIARYMGNIYLRTTRKVKPA